MIKNYHFQDYADTFCPNHTVDCNLRCTVNGDILLLILIFQYKVFFGLVWLTSNHMFGSGDFCDKSPSWLLKILKLLSFYSGNFKIFKNPQGQFIPNRPPKRDYEYKQISVNLKQIGKSNTLYRKFKWIPLKMLYMNFLGSVA